MTFSPSGECLHVLMGHVAAVRCVQYDGKRVISGAYDYMVKVWNPDSEECLYTLQVLQSRDVRVGGGVSRDV